MRFLIPASLLLLLSAAVDAFPLAQHPTTRPTTSLGFNSPDVADQYDGSESYLNEWKQQPGAKPRPRRVRYQPPQPVEEPANTRFARYQRPQKEQKEDFLARFERYNPQPPQQPHDPMARLERYSKAPCHEGPQQTSYGVRSSDFMSDVSDKYEGSKTYLQEWRQEQTTGYDQGQQLKRSYQKPTTTVFEKNPVRSPPQTSPTARFERYSKPREERQQQPPPSNTVRSSDFQSDVSDKYEGSKTYLQEWKQEQTTGYEGHQPLKRAYQKPRAVQTISSRYYNLYKQGEATQQQVAPSATTVRSSDFLSDVSEQYEGSKTYLHEWRQGQTTGYDGR